MIILGLDKQLNSKKAVQKTYLKKKPNLPTTFPLIAPLEARWVHLFGMNCILAY